MDVPCWFVVGAIGMLVIPSLAAFCVEGAWRHRWRIEHTREDALTVKGQGAFREATVRAALPEVDRDRAPGWLRAAAFSCWFLGQMVIPGFLAWCVGLLVLADVRHAREPVALALMASFFPGAWCAWLLWQAGSSLVLGERDRADRATRLAARVIVAYNALILAAAGARLLCHPVEEVLLGCMAYALVSIAHVAAVRAVFVAHRAEFPVENAQP